MKDKNDFDLVVNGGPYYMNRQSVLVYKWSTVFDFKTDVLKKFPIWI